MLEQKEIWIILKYFLARHRNWSVHLYCHFLTGEKIPGLQVYYLIQKANALIVLELFFISVRMNRYSYLVLLKSCSNQRVNCG